MAFRTLEVVLQANVGEYKAQLGAAAASTRQFGREVTSTAVANKEAAAAVGKLGVVTGGVLVTGMAASAKAAIDFESAFAGVRKTVNATEAEFGVLRTGILQMATELPTSANEIAGVAEAAGQLGVKQDAILAFTRTMVDLGETTNLTANDAATSLARISNIMQTSSADVDRMGSTIVELGNNSATTESEIVGLATRLAAAGQIAGLSEADVFSFASTLTSVGVEAEAGGTALSKVFTSIRDSVIDGSEQLDVFAQVAGVSAERFSRAFEDDAAGAIALFIQGLGDVSAAGQSTSGIFAELELTDQRLVRALLSTAGAGSLLTDQLELGNKAWEENTALTAEADQRYGTTAAQLEILKNKIVDVAIGFGEQMLPAVGAVVEGVGKGVDAFGGLVETLGPVGPIVGGVVGSVTLLGGGFLLLAPRIAATKRAFDTLGIVVPSLSGKLGGLSKAAGGVAVAFAAAQAVDQWAKVTADNVPGIEELTASLFDLSEASMLTGPLLAITGDNFESLGKKIKVAGNSPFSIFDSAGIREVQEANQQIDALDKALAALFARDPGQAADLFDQLTAAAADQGVSIELVRDRFDDYMGAVAGAEVEQRLLADGAGGLEGAMGGLTTGVEEGTFAFEQQEAAAKLLAERYEGLGDAASEFTDGLSAYESILADKTEAERTAAEETAAATEDASDSWADHAKEVKVTLADVTAKLEEQVSNLESWKDNLAKIARTGRLDVVEELMKLGPDGADMVALFANASEEEMNRAGDLLVAAARDGGERTGEALSTEMAVLAAIARTGGKETAKAIAEELDIGAADVERIAGRYGANLAAGINPILVGVGKPTVLHRAMGDIADAHAPEIAPGGSWRVWAEPETQGEAYIPLANDHRRGRALSIWEETGRRLGAWDDTHYADGGFHDPADVPRPPSVEHRGPVIGYAGGVTMDHSYDAVVEFIEKNGGVAGGDLVAIGRSLQALGFRVSGHAAFGGTPRSGHAPNSYHYRNRAIDVNWGPPGQSAIEMTAIDALMPKLAGKAFAEKLWRVKGHYDHLHLAMAEGGILAAPGSIANPYVRDAGGPVRAGTTFTGPTQEATA